MPQTHATRAWQLARVFVSAACERVGLMDVSPIEQQVLDGSAVLWLAASGTDVIGAGVTHIFNQAGTRVCELLAWGSNDHSRCAPLLGTIEEFARAQGCDCVRLVGRKGWVRHLADYRLKAVIIEKAL